MLQAFASLVPPLLTFAKVPLLQVVQLRENVEDHFPAGHDSHKEKVEKLEV